MSHNTSQITPEFSHPFRVDKIKAGGSREKGEANADQRAKIAQRLGINAVEDLKFACELKPWKKGGAAVNCKVMATINQTCVVSLDEFESELELSVSRYFTHRPASSGLEEVLDLEALDDDIPDQIVDGEIDLGELVSEELALSLDLHPRKPGAVFSDHMESTPVTQGQSERPNPFAALKVLKGGSDGE